MKLILACIVGVALDFALGERLSAICPAVLFGKLIAALEPALRKRFPATKQGERTTGILLVLIVCVIAFVVPWAILMLCGLIWEWLPVIISAFWLYQIVATKGLADAGMTVYNALASGDLEASRKAVGMIVGRDTDRLDEAGVVRGTVETIAENTSDGIIAPVFWFVIGGAPLAMLYKAINTMDSMIGYKNDQYRYFGTCAALLDDVVNWIPARLSAFALMFSALFVKDADASRAFKIWRRDRRKSPSPNSAQTESVVAGALGVKLLGPMYYFGVLHDKEFIGDEVRAIEPDDIKRTNRLMYGAVIASTLVFCAIRLALQFAIGGEVL
ncbi:MAG: adenosylcobinamide-phosphate synthase CbiB [Eggerthellaceae bacterium]|nr:adenosylcobinamide-phosphate synthase CbiB [Eggerthellaceae bacterium]